MRLVTNLAAAFFYIALADARLVVVANDNRKA